MEDWAAVAADVLAAIEEVGFTVTLRSVSGPETPWDTTAAVNTDVTAKAVDRKPVTRRNAMNEQVRVRRLALPATVTPTIAQRVQVRGVWHNIMRVETIAPGGEDVLHILELGE